jgi:hypothetical protein
MTLIADGPTIEEIRNWPATVPIARGAAALGLSKSWAYQLAAEGEFPCRVLRVRGRTRVLTTSLLHLLETGEP